MVELHRLQLPEGRPQSRLALEEHRWLMLHDSIHIHAEWKLRMQLPIAA